MSSMPFPARPSWTVLLATIAGLAAAVGVACGGKAIIDSGGSGGGTTTISTSTSTSGTGGAECTGPADCPSPSSVCEAPTCIGGYCGMVAQPGGVLCDEAGTAVCDGAGNCVDLCTELCFDITYCINDPTDDCIASCQSGIVGCSTGDLSTLLACHLAFDLDCGKLMGFTDCVNAVGCVEQ